MTTLQALPAGFNSSWQAEAPAPPGFSFDGSALRWRALVHTLLKRLPPLNGEPIQIQRVPGLRDRYGAVHAGSFLRERRIAFNCTHAEFARIFIHELFHFVWVRLGNRRRWSFEELVKAEVQCGELGWSAERRRNALRKRDPHLRTRKWREYCCESFCDTAAWMFAGAAKHTEFTLPEKYRQGRRKWFRENIAAARLSI